MNLQDVVDSLAAAGTEQTRKTYARHGVKRPMYGVSYAHLEKLRRTIKIDQTLAEQLWNTGNHDARVLAAMIADPARASVRSLKAWVDEVDHALVGGVLSKLASKSQAAEDCFKTWKASKKDPISAMAWTLLAEMTMNDGTQPEQFWNEQLRTIEAEIQNSQNSTKYAMNSALIAIGLRSASLEKRAIQAAGRIGKVEVDHGDTACKTPDAAAYIRKAAARKKK